MRYWARPGCFSKLSDAFHTWNEWLWEACRISVGEANLAGWGRTHPWGPSFDTISRSTLSTFRPWPSAIPKDSPLLLPSPTHTVGPKGRNTHCSYRLCEKFSGLCENKDPEFLQGNGIVSETNKQTNLIWWLSMRKARGELFTVGSSSDFIHLEAKAGSRPWPCWGNNSGHSEPPQGLPVSSAQTAGEGVVCVDYLCSLSEKTQQKNKAPLLLAMLRHTALLGSFCWGVGVQVVQRCCLQPSPGCQLVSLWAECWLWNRAVGLGEERGWGRRCNFVTEETCPSRSSYTWSKPILWKKHEILVCGGWGMGAGRWRTRV